MGTDGGIPLVASEAPRLMRRDVGRAAVVLTDRLRMAEEDETIPFLEGDDEEEGRSDGIGVDGFVGVVVVVVVLEVFLVVIVWIGDTTATGILLC